MKPRSIFVALLIVMPWPASFAQYSLTEKQKYMISEWRDAYGGQIYYAYNYPKAHTIYQELVRYSGMQYPVVFGQTFQWGQAHAGGLIILDYSTINKNRHILAFVLAHEWGHQALGHQANVYNPAGSSWKFRSSPTETEDEADVYSGRFLASNGYDLDIVYNYLASLPVTDDHTHSTGRQRAELVKHGYTSMHRSTSGNSASPERSQRVTVPCVHRVHPGGHVSPCRHALHANGDLVQCTHVCLHPAYGRVPCHPNGDIIPCSHAMHSGGDVSPCDHILHPDGDTRY